MFDSTQLWKERFQKTSRELKHYSRYIFNGHFVIVMMFLIGGGSYYYQSWVKTLTPNFPAALVAAILLALVLTYSPIFTFFLDADRIFLLPLETKLTTYIQRSLTVSFFVQIYLLIILFVALLPMYLQIYRTSLQTLTLYFVLIVAVKGWNIIMRWKVQFFVESSVHIIDSFIRYFLNATFVYLLFSQANMIYFAILLVLMLLLAMYFIRQTKTKGLQWEWLISQEEKRLNSFYRLANMFTDVPKLRARVKRRKWLDWVLTLISNRQSETYLYLFTRTFLRAGDYFGLFVRLTIIGMLAIYFIPNEYGRAAFALLFIYLTGLQLLPLWKHHENKLWVDLYPVKNDRKLISFQKLLMTVLSTQLVIFTVLLLVVDTWFVAAASTLIGFGLIYYFVHVYCKKLE